MELVYQRYPIIPNYLFSKIKGISIPISRMVYSFSYLVIHPCIVGNTVMAMAISYNWSEMGFYIPSMGFC
jgi:hypothetical protein